MNRAQSIKVRLSMVFLLFFGLVIALGLESLRSVSYLNDVSAQIRDHWLPSTRALGDLNNFTTDFPAAQAALLKAGAEERAPIVEQMKALDSGIAVAMRAYRQIAHDPREIEVFASFESIWNDYRQDVLANAESVSIPASDDATLLKRSAARYAEVVRTLGELTDSNESSARRASVLSSVAYSEARRRILVTILLAGLIVVGAMIYVQRSISAPLVGLADRMHRLAANDTQLEVAGTTRQDEIGDMARAVVVFRNNATDLAKSRQSIGQQAELLKKKLAEEQEVTLLQRNFVSMASHEFRTPLGVIDGQAQRLITLRDRLPAVELVGRAQKIRLAVLQMTRLIDDLIGSARLLDGPVDLNFLPTRVVLADILSEVSELQRELAPGREIVANLSVPLTGLWGDKRLLQQLFGNLLANALKYSPPGTPVSISASRDSGATVVIVSDRGIGIPANDQQRVFERYFRGSNTSGVAGSGVGLYLVKVIVDLHGGSIDVASTQGIGATFTVHLPDRILGRALASELPLDAACIDRIS